MRSESHTFKDWNINDSGETIEIPCANWRVARVSAYEQYGAWGTAIIAVKYKMRKDSPARDFVPAIRLSPSSPSQVVELLAPIVVFEVSTVEGAEDLLTLDVFFADPTGV